MNRHESGVLQRALGKSCSLCICDWDGTLRPGFLIVDWVLYLSKKLSVPSVRHHQLLTFVERYRANEISYESFANAAIEVYAKVLSGLNCQDVRELSDAFVIEDSRNLFPSSRPLLTAIKERGYKIVVISGAPLIPLLSYSKLLRIDHTFAVDAACNQNGFFEDRIIKNYALPQNKQRIINELISRGFEIAMAFGDSASDKPLLDAAKYPFFVGAESRGINSQNYWNVTPDTIISTVVGAVFE